MSRADRLPTRAVRRLGRLLEPLFAPDAASQRERLDRLIGHVEQQREGLKELATQMRAQRTALDALQQLRSADVADTQARLGGLRVAVRRHGTTLTRLARRAGIEAELEVTEQHVLERLERLRRSDRPIVVGPWTGEIGFELLYWIPFVRWAVRKYQLPAERLTIVSRGGTASWYAGVGANYVDVFTLANPDEFRVRTEATKKQRAMGTFDRELLRRVRASLGAGRVDLLHPAMMYALFMPFWKRQAPPSRVLAHADYRAIEAPAVAEMPPLPRKYVAVRFYFSNCFPDTPGNRTFVASVVATLSERTDVVMLNPGFQIDDHADFSPDARSRVHTIDMSSRPQDNLAWQTAIIAGAQAFVGTYGGFSYLAPFCGVHAIAFYSERNYFTYHLELASQAFEIAGGSAIDALDVTTLHDLRQALGVPAGWKAIPPKLVTKLEQATNYEYLWHKARKRIDVRTLDGFGEIAARTVTEHRTGMRQDRLYTLWQAVAGLAPTHAVAEVGSYKGGTARFIGEAMRWHGRSNPFFVCDTFRGHAVVDTSLAEVTSYLADLQNVRIVPGDFRETSQELVPAAPFSFVHLDVDVYPVMRHALEFFAERVMPGGVIVVDDYGFTTCHGTRKAVDEFAAARREFRMFHLLTGQALLVRLGR